MFRSMGMVCAGTVLALVAGCTLNEFTLIFTGVPKGPETVLPGSLDTWAVSAKTTMGQMGLYVTETRLADKIRLASTTQDRQQFVVILERKKGVDQTVVHLEWDKQPDEKLTASLLEGMARMHASQAWNPQANEVNQVPQNQWGNEGTPVQYQQPSLSNNLRMGEQ